MTNPEIDRERLDAVAAVVGARRMMELIAILQTRLDALTEDLPNLSGPDLLSLVHRNRGSASTLGLSGLARRLDALERLILKLQKTDHPAAPSAHPQIRAAVAEMKSELLITVQLESDRR